MQAALRYIACDLILATIDRVRARQQTETDYNAPSLTLPFLPQFFFLRHLRVQQFCQKQLWLLRQKAVCTLEPCAVHMTLCCIAYATCRCMATVLYHDHDSLAMRQSIETYGYGEVQFCDGNIVPHQYSTLQYQSQHGIPAC